jgi:hypothetical protein
MTQYTERALLDDIIPSFVYLPRNLRSNGLRITEDMLRLTVNDHTEAENQARIRGCDAHGFLIALMQGQPIPTFIIEQDNSITVHYRVADMPTRIDIAKFFVARRKDGKDAPEDTYEAMIARARVDTPPDAVQGDDVEGDSR